MVSFYSAQWAIGLLTHCQDEGIFFLKEQIRTIAEDLTYELNMDNRICRLPYGKSLES